MTMEKLGLYVHIPFCVKKCNYCGFVSIDDYTSMEEADYTMALLKEIVLYKKVLGHKYELDSIFIGGGTPSCMPEKAIGAIISEILANFQTTKDCEITIEANPKTLSYTKLDSYLKSGINRLSMGVQSFHRDELTGLGRIHTPQEFYENYSMAREVGFQNINFDLMFGIPNQTPEKWAASIGVAAKLRPEHISFYSLELEKNSPLFWSVGKGEVELPTEVEDRVMYHFAVAALKKEGYNHYEISNVALPGYECKHNLKYWSMKPYLGIGLSASSFVNGRRSKNVDTIEKYVSALNRDLLPFEAVHKNTVQDSMSEFVFTGLRKMEGLDLEAFREMFGDDFNFVYKEKMQIIHEYIESGFLERHGRRLKLTETGIDVSNKIMAEFV